MGIIKGGHNRLKIFAILRKESPIKSIIFVEDYQANNFRGLKTFNVCYFT